MAIYTPKGEQVFTIYRITNSFNSKTYIGFTSQKPKYRWNQHKSVSATTDSHLYRAMKKIGVDNFSFEVIYQSTDGIHCYSVMEQHFIEEHDSISNGYNSLKGGNVNLNRAIKEESIEKQRKKMKGRKFSDTHRENLSNATKGKKKAPLSVETKQKISSALKGKGGPNLSTEAIASMTNKLSCDWLITTPTGEIIKIRNLKEFCREFGLDDSAMGRVSKNIQKSHKGYTCHKI